MSEWSPSRSEVKARAQRLWRGFPGFCIATGVLTVSFLGLLAVEVFTHAG